MDENRTKAMTASAVVRRCRSALSALKDASNKKEEEMTDKKTSATPTTNLPVIVDLDASTEEEDDDEYVPMPRTIGEELKDAQHASPIKERKELSNLPDTPVRKRTPARKTVTTPPAKIEFLAASPIVTTLEGDYASVDIDAHKNMMTQEQVDILVKKSRAEIERRFAVKMALMEDQLKEAMEESERSRKEQAETASIVSEFEKTCEEIKERCNQQLQQQLAMFTEMSAKTKSELEATRKECAAEVEKRKKCEEEMEKVQSAVRDNKSEHADLVEKIAKQSVVIATYEKKAKAAEKHRAKCDARYKEHMENAQSHCKREKRKRAEAEAALLAIKAELDVAKEAVAEAQTKEEKTLRSLEASRKDAAKARAEVESVRRELALSQKAEADVREEFKRHKDAEPDHSELYKELTKSLLDLKKTRARCEKLEAEKAEVLGMCEDLMRQVEGK